MIIDQLAFNFDAKPMPRFSGSTYDPSVDKKRLAGQMLRVWDAMKSGEWLTLGELRSRTGGCDSEAGISARIRDFRKKEFGGHTVDRRRRDMPERGIWEYRLVLNEGE